MPDDLRLRALASALNGAPLQIDDAVIDLAIDHGVAALLARSPAGRAAAEPGAARLRAHLREREVLTAIQDREIVRVLDLLAARGVCPLVIKGAHLAHAIYPSPALRPRGDTDLLIADRDREQAAAALADAGYSPLAHVRGSVILGQFHFIRRDAVGVPHALDVHWRVAAPLLFASVLPIDALRGRAVRVPALGAQACGPSRADALVLACIHLAAHHRDSAILLWLYDLLLLASALDDREHDAFVDTVVRSRVAAICAHALGHADHFFDDGRLAALASRLRAEAEHRQEPSARLLTLARPVDGLLLDLRTSPTWGLRVRLLREHLVPNRDYMRARHTRGWLPLAYARRAITGAPAWLRAHASGRTSKDHEW